MAPVAPDCDTPLQLSLGVRPQQHEMRTLSAIILGSLTFVTVSTSVLIAEVPLIHRFAALIEHCAPSNQVCDGGQMVGFYVGTMIALVAAGMLSRAVFRQVRQGGLHSPAA
jgi:hypothetical protein